MRLVCGFLPVQRGTIAVAGLDVMVDSLGVRRNIGYLPEHVPLYPELRVREHLTYRAVLKGVSGRRREVERVARATGIEKVLPVPIGHLSRGYRQRVGVADALLGEPSLLILDEPTVGLDPNQVVEIRSMLRELPGDQTLVFSSHILAEVELLCDQVVILSEGHRVAHESVDAATRGGRVLAAWVGSLAEARAVVEAVVAQRPARVQWEADAPVATLEPDDGDGEGLRRAVGRASAERGLALDRLEMARGRLEERFAAVTGGQARGEGP
jgi:ABC-2 type transport system ATP-binding protein